MGMSVEVVGEAAAATVFRIIEMQGLSAPGDSATVKWTGNRKSVSASTGFILRNLAGEYVVIPAGDNIGAFGGAILMNELSAFVWEQLKVSVSRDELLARILDRYEVEEKTAAADLDALLAEMKRMGIIEE